MEYFVIQDLGYDGLMVIKFDSREQAENKYTELQEDIKRQIKEYREDNADKGLALIEGKIIKAQDICF